MNLIGYARVSTDDQTTQPQVEALEAAGCVRIFRENVSGAAASRPELDACLAYLNAGDTLVVWRLDRLGRSLAHLVAVVEQLGAEGKHFRSLTESLDTSTSSGRLMFHIAGAFAQFERDLISERTRAGLAASTKRPGRPPVMSDAMKKAAEQLRRQDDSPSYGAIAQALQVSEPTVRRYLSSVGL